MDSFFKAAVCDLDKLLDDFELNSEEVECKPVFLKPTAHPFSSLGSQCLPSEASTAPQSLPDLNSLHYGSATSCSDGSSSHNHREVKGQPLTGVDLLSSVDRRPAKSSAPPCPDRSLKPVCDLVNDASSAILTRTNSHDVFRELDMAEQQMEEEEEEEEKKEEEEALLVDFNSPVVTEGGPSVSISGASEEQTSAGSDGLLGLNSHEQVGGYFASLSLLDVILPAAVEKGSEPTDESPSTRTTESVDEAESDREEAPSSNHVAESSVDHPETEHVDSFKEMTAMNKEEESNKAFDESVPESTEDVKCESSDSEPVSLSCLPIAVSMCGALVNSKTREDDFGAASEQCDEADVSESNKLDCLSALEAKDSSRDPFREDKPCLDNSESDQISEHRLSSEGQHAPLVSAAAVPPANLSSSDCSEPSPEDLPEFGFEHLPESDQAELLVTDEELDAFLQAHAEAEQGAGVSYCCSPRDDTQPESLSASDALLEEQKPQSCDQDRQEYLEGLASPESDRTISLSAAGGLNSGAPSLSQDFSRPCHEDSSEVSHSLTSNTFQSQHNSSPDQQPSYGGARPKRPHCQTARPPSAEKEGEEQAQALSASSMPEDEDSLTVSPSPVEEHSNFRNSCHASASRDHQDCSVGFDELSEPPPYPGEQPADAVRPVNWKRDGVEELGSKQPKWVPDSEAPSCMNCEQRFTFTKRRHHCRACGKVYCAACCNRKCILKYMGKEARVCILCFVTINKAQNDERKMSPAGPSPNPNVPSEYCSTIPPLQQARAAGTLNSPPPTVMVPVSVLKHPNNDACPREQKRVWFADGILPNGEVADTTKLSVTSRRSSQEFSPDPETPGSSGSDLGVSSSSAPDASGAVEVVRPPVSGPWDYGLLSGIGSAVKRIPSLLPDNEDELPPLLISTEEDDGKDVLVEESPAPCQILHLLEEGGPRPLIFVLNANLLVNVKLVTYSDRQCWCFGSNGLQALGQKEVVFLLECLPGEKTLPRDFFSLYLSIYQDAQKGKFVEELDNVTFTTSFLGSKDHAGMLFFPPTCQPLDGLTLPPQPFLFGTLIQKLEVPWAKVFPLRLLLRLGAAYDVYPTTLLSVRFRDSVYRETGHTIMNLLADLRNYQYSLPVVEGLRIHMEMGHSYIDIPKSSFSEMQKVVNSSNEHVISIGAGFSLQADSHLVCLQNEEGNYQTQANSMPGKTRTVTGASFVVFNGALKASSGFIAKSSIVEDGLMVQIPPETMESLRSALREQTDFHIPCGKNDGGEVRENVTIRWIDWTSPVNSGQTSGVDGRPLDGVRSMKMQQDTEFECDGRTIRCTEVFYQLKSPDCSLASVLASCSMFQKEIALATCSALTPHLSVLASSSINSLSLRVSTQADMVEYQAGSGGRLLPQCYMNEMDDALIPVIHGGSASVPQTAMDLEFTFYITHII
ncbi:zinc finger FYVE domain-containing protein 16 [Kryptolebias marmoratus]|uniref:Zinc finger, FYVE domain containing 16 n=1 Tax=Kryptolebias marmoratus TaxID=37003 RepID=A0A3Q3GCJ3_KRYMA|nr:zinc finger FYVE domain-containing protein 16 [Kryptolebias marmoratus]XP_017287741.1 zinc finger FYVE domain-containing protein 16 [Kryptolebias marmoratus]XP_017287742.1 zinc finger FYVE domain-containing protein 16 [Kryptolebias marmoratus]